MRCRALVALSKRRTKQYGAIPSSSSSAGATKQRSPNVNSTASILTLVAAELERRWEAALKEVRAADEALARLKSPQATAEITVGNKALNNKVVRLSGRLPEIWTDPSTTDTKRKALLRCLIDKVILDRGEHDVVRARIVWRGGAVTEIEVKMRVNSIANLTQGTKMGERVLELARTKMHDDEIAAMLTSEGHRSPNCRQSVADHRPAHSLARRP
jgi:hypothetical protein